MGGNPNWGALRTMVGPAHFVPAALRRLFTATTEDEATIAYWELDNRVVVQGQLFEAAEPVARELVFGICASEISPAGLPRALDLLVELASGEADATEVDLGNPDLGDRCRAQITRGLVCIGAYAEAEDERVRIAVRELIVRLAHDGYA